MNEQDLGYGQHTKRTYILGTLAFVVIGLVLGFFIFPEDWSLVRTILGGIVMGLWSGFCIFSWRFLFFGDAEAAAATTSTLGDENAEGLADPVLVSASERESVRDLP